MSPDIRFLAAAERDLEAALAWYESQQSGLGARLLSEVAHLLGQLQDAPLSWPIRYRNLRRALLRKFPYSLWYLASKQGVLVVALTHVRFGPRRLRRKLADTNP